MYIFQVAQVSNVQGTDHVCSECVRFVIFAPVNVGAAGNTSGHENMRRLNFIQLLGNFFTILNSGFSKEYLNFS
jgi:hypothetical protein